MTFSLSTKASLTESLALVLTDQIDALFGARSGEAHAAEVHDTRKSIKRLRALLRLYRGALPHALYRREDTALRTLGQALGQARDAVALGESLHRLILGAPADARARLADYGPALEDALIGASAASPKDVSLALSSVHDGLAAVRARAADWAIERRGWSAIAPGLRRTYARGRRALARARHRPSEKRLHTLRTWVKRHQYQLTLLEPLWREPIKAFRHEAQRLGELLGNDHDLSLLERRFERLALRPDLAPLESVLRAAAEGSHSAFQREALDLGARLYAESSARFAARYREYFDAWP